MTVAAATARERSSSLSDQLHTIELVRPVPQPAPPQSILSSQMQNLGVSSRSANAPVPTQPQALLTSHPETFSMIQSHLQDAVRSIGGAVPWSEHQHLDTNSEGTKRAHVVSSETGYQNRMDNAIQLQRQQPPVSNGPVPQALHQPMPLQMPRPLATQFPPVQTNSSAEKTQDFASTNYPAHHIPDVKMAPNPFVGGTAGSSVAPQMEEAPVQNGYLNGGPSSVHPGFTPSTVGMQVGETTSTNHAAGDLFQHGVTPPPPLVGGSMQSNPGQVCQPTTVTSMDAMKTKVSISLRLILVWRCDLNLTLAFPFQPCRIQGCDEIAVARRPYCVKHSGNRLCEHAGCTKCAQGSTRFCIAHGGGRRCTYPGCDKGARDKFFCAA